MRWSARRSMSRPLRPPSPRFSCKSSPFSRGAGEPAPLADLLPLKRALLQWAYAGAPSARRSHVFVVMGLGRPVVGDAAGEGHRRRARTIHQPDRGRAIVVAPHDVVLVIAV